MNVFILIFMLLLTIVSIALTYYCLTNLEQKKKVIFIIVSAAIVYMLVSMIYGFSSKSVGNEEIAQKAHDFIVFTFVPVNLILTMPWFAKAYSKYANEKLDPIDFRNRVILLVIEIIFLLIIEYFYFKDIQLGILKMRN